MYACAVVALKETCSNLIARDPLNSNGLQPKSDGLQPSSGGLQPNSEGFYQVCKSDKFGDTRFAICSSALEFGVRVGPGQEVFGSALVSPGLIGSGRTP